METSAGVNLFTTQPSTQVAFLENFLVLDKGKGGKGKTRGVNPPSKKKKAPNQSLDLERGGEKLKAMTRIRMTAWMLTRPEEEPREDYRPSSLPDHSSKTLSAEMIKKNSKISVFLGQQKSIRWE
ncbi:hypothetical protein R1flu_008531 [Riccia fluitans]|uniref:Uncharacterized protein n=1 Tax=Riccia fluitans TaxID=41844 RepID=A0ABD1YC90_9MARC